MRYLIISFIIALIPAIFISLNSERGSDIRRIGDTIAFTFRVIFVVTFIFSVAYTWNRMRGPSFSKEVRRLVLKRHIITALLYLITNLYMTINEISCVMASNKDEYEAAYGETYAWWAKILKLLFAS